MKIVYSKVKSEEVGNLKNHFKKFFEGTEVVNFILNELNARRDTILFDEKASSAEKEGALKQLRELVGFFNGGIAYYIQNIIKGNSIK
jgi:hypothetical protein